MNLAIIAPTSMLHWCTHGDGIQMALAQHVLNEKELEYKHFFRSRSLAGEYVILDNGAAESVTGHASELNVAAGMVKAKEVVVPDVLNNAQLTMEYGDAYLNNIIERRMIVPHGRTLDEWKKCAQFLLNLGAVYSLGLPKWSPIPRTHVLEEIEKQHWNDTLQIHLLGLQGDPIQVKWLANAFPWIRSVDTAAPIAYAQQGHLIAEYPRVGHCSLQWDGPSFRDNLNPKIGPASEFYELKQANIAVANIELLKEWCHGTTTTNT